MSANADPGARDGRFSRAVAAFAAVHREDPRTVEVPTSGGEGGTVPFAVRYHERLAHWVEALDPEAPEALRLAAHCQHIRRWSIPRGDYPAGAAGYKRWRTALALRHGEEAAAVLEPLGYGPELIERVRALLLKKGLRSDPEVQLLEDAVCLVFFELEYGAFAQGQPPEKVIDVLQKTWNKMSAQGHEAARSLVARSAAAGDLSPQAVRLVEEAIGAGS